MISLISVIEKGNIVSIDEYTTDIDLLAKEGDKGADYIEELLDIADLGGDLDIDVENDRATVSVVDEEDSEARELQRLVGEDGEVLEALQELTRLHTQREMGFRSRLMLDIANFRKNKRNELTAIAEEAVTKMKVTGEPVKLAPMNPFERKVCHDVAAAAGFVSESEGQAPERCVVIKPIEVASLEDKEESNKKTSNQSYADADDPQVKDNDPLYIKEDENESSRDMVSHEENN